MGVHGKVPRSTIAATNEQRNWQIYADLAYSIIHTAGKLNSDEPLVFELEQTAYAFDATNIDLCLSMFPWANFRENKGTSNCMHYWICVAASRPSFIAPTAIATQSTRSISFPTRQDPFT